MHSANLRLEGIKRESKITYWVFIFLISAPQVGWGPPHWLKRKCTQPVYVKVIIGSTDKSFN